MLRFSRPFGNPVLYIYNSKFIQPRCGICEQDTLNPQLGVAIICKTRAPWAWCSADRGRNLILMSMYFKFHIVLVAVSRTEPVTQRETYAIMIPNFVASYSQAYWGNTGCPGNSECQVFSAGTTIIVAQNLIENTVWQCFEGFLTRFYELCIRHLDSGS
jgi:hypothetical protein